MPTEHIKANFETVLKDVNSFRPKRAGKFITRVIMTSPPSPETLKIDPAEFPFDATEIKKTVKKKKGKGAKGATEEVEEAADAAQDADHDEPLKKQELAA